MALDAPAGLVAARAAMQILTPVAVDTSHSRLIMYIGWRIIASIIVVVLDAAHAMLSFDCPPNSFLATPGAMDVGVEIHSLSKGFHMIGWRIGWVCGHERIVKAFADIKDNCDSGQFIAIQKAAVTALEDDGIPVNVRQKYGRRLEKLVEALRGSGFDYVGIETHIMFSARLAQMMIGLW